jgi:signal transduction histidine kinase
LTIVNCQLLTVSGYTYDVLNSLRGRLLLSYIVVIGATLVVVAVALFGFATLSSVRFIPVLQRLATISQTNQAQIIQLVREGGGASDLEALLEETARESAVRILIASVADRQVIYDSETANNWVGDQLVEVDQVERIIIPNLDRNSIFGSFRHPNGSLWLVYAQPNAAFERALIFYAQPQPRPDQFFREFFVRPLAIAGLMAFVLAIILALAITRSVAAPLRKMAGAAEAIALGEYDQQLSMEGPDEVQRVAHSFNTMAEQVQSARQVQRDFVANVSHDLKTPITSISGWSQALLDGTASSAAEQQRAAATIYDEAQRMSRMVSELLDLTRIETGQLRLGRQPVDLGQVLTDVHRNLSLRAQAKAINFQLDLMLTPPVLGDADRLTQVFTNLADNALAYTPNGGQVRLTGRTYDGQWVEGIIQDNGPGIPTEELPRVFERFYQVEKSRTRSDGRRGSGLGLAIVRELVEAHGGQVFAFSQSGQGTTFTVRLPASL